ncbi:kinesin-like protein KIF27 isoform 1-T2 [Synchiropus picturatus]
MAEICVRVAVRVRPLLPKEVLRNHQVCVRVGPGSSQVMIGADRMFDFDHAFGPAASQREVYESCVRPLVEALVEGFNATVFCYGQTGSGKTYTLGGGKLDKEEGIIDCVAQDLFLLLDNKKRANGVGSTVRVSYVEVYREELLDLLELNTSQKGLHIREDDRGNTVVKGAKETVVTSAEDLLSVLGTGNALRHTGSTGMNEQSSRSHAILTLFLTQQESHSVLFSKIYLVDLAGSERAGKTGNTGTRFKESVNINSGLLALGNVIRALSENGRNRPGSHFSSAHIPYRDAKITRLLRDSLGGSAHTLMVACVSPSDQSLPETLNVLQFASKARHIRNRPRATSGLAEYKPCVTAWDPGEPPLEEQEHKAKTPSTVKDDETEKAESVEGQNDEEIHLTDKEMDQTEPFHYRQLVQEAATLLAEARNSTENMSFQQRLQEWQERFSRSHWPDDPLEGNQTLHATLSQLREELPNCEDAQSHQSEAESCREKKDIDKLLQACEAHLQELDEEKERTRLQNKQLVDHQILISQLREEIKSLRRGTSETKVCGVPEKRPSSAPLDRQELKSKPDRQIHSSPPVCSLEKLTAAYKIRGQLLLAELEMNSGAYAPVFHEANRFQEQKEDHDGAGKKRYRPSLNSTWTVRQKKSSQKDQSSEISNLFSQQNQQNSDTKDSAWRTTGQRVSVLQRRIHELSVNMRMKEELIKELDKTDMETRAVSRHGRESGDGSDADVLARLSVQSRQTRSELHLNLQQMRLKRAELQNQLRQEQDACNKGGGLRCHEEGSTDFIICKSNPQEETVEKNCDTRWLEEAEEEFLQRRAKLEDWEEDLRMRAELLLQREQCLEQKNKLEVKKLRSSQALSQDLLHVSVRLESLEEELQSRDRRARGLTVEELEEEKDLLLRQRDTLDSQLKDQKVLNEEEEQSRLQLEEAIEALDAALEFKNRSIQDKQRSLSISDSSLSQSQNSDPPQNIIMKLKELSHPEVSELLVKYFNKVVCLREVERRLRVQCEELELQSKEQEVMLKEKEAAMQCLALDTDRRLTQQQRDHQNSIQLLLQGLKEGSLGNNSDQERMQHLEKELFFYKTHYRKLVRKSRDVPGNSQQQHPDTHPGQTLVHRRAEPAQMPADDTQARPFTKVHHDRKKTQDPPMERRQSPYSTSLAKSQSKAKHLMLAMSQETKTSSHFGENAEVAPARVRRRQLRQISPTELQQKAATTRGRHLEFQSSTECLSLDSIDQPSNNDY